MSGGLSDTRAECIGCGASFAQVVPEPTLCAECRWWLDKRAANPDAQRVSSGQEISDEAVEAGESKLRFSERELLARAREGKPLLPKDAVAVLERLGRLREGTS